MIKNKRPVYIEEYEELFVDVQTQRILTDQKTFVDSEPRFLIKDILKQYRAEKNVKGFNLKEFFEIHFQFPDDKGSAVINSTTTSEDHINGLWDVLTIW